MQLEINLVETLDCLCEPDWSRLMYYRDLGLGSVFLVDLFEIEGSQIEHFKWELIFVFDENMSDEEHKHDLKSFIFIIAAHFFRWHIHLEIL